MSLPQLVEILPLKRPIRARVAVPGSKSITNRALILAALSKGHTVLRGALWSEDTQVMVECLRRLGLDIRVEPDPAEPGNRMIAVTGRDASPGRPFRAGPLGESFLPRAGGTREQPLELFVGNAGTAARFLAAFVCLGHGSYRLRGVPRMHERPQAELFNALRLLGYEIEAPGEHLPAIIHTTGPRPGKCRVSMKASSQFASALLLSARVGGWEVEVEGENVDEAPYVTMTRELIKNFPRRGGTFVIEPDASSASYLVAADFLMRDRHADGPSSRIELCIPPSSNLQVDAHFQSFLPLPPEVSRARDLGDSILTAMIVAAFSPRPVRFTDLGRLRVQECERVTAMKMELTRCGAQVIEEGDTLTVFPSADRLNGADIETYNDHRIAMCFSVLGLFVPGIRIRNPECVKKTFPNFFVKLALPPPDGLGTVILDVSSGSQCDPGRLSAD